MRRLTVTPHFVVALVLACLALSLVAASPPSPLSLGGVNSTILASSRSKLSHPATITLPMKRSSSYHKASARANSGSHTYKRFLGAMAHGAMLQAREHEMHTMSSTTSSSPLTGCPFTDFTIPVEVGTTWFELIADTGSSTLAVAGSTCSCNSVSPTWTESSYSADKSATCSSSYGDGSSWTGEIWNDRVAFGDSDDDAVTAYQTINVAVITSQSDFFSTSYCYTSSGETASSIQGIVGLAYSNLAVSSSSGVSTNSFLMQLFAANSDLEETFAIQMCASSGQLWVGGVDTATYTGSPLYTPIVDTAGYGRTYYTVQPYDMYVDGVALGYTSSSWGSISIVDSGTTLWELPTTIYDSLVTSIISNTNFQKYFRYATSDNFFQQASSSCETPTVTATYAKLQSVLPTISIRMVNGLKLTMDGVGSYLLPCDAAYTQWTPGIADSSSTQMIGGWPLMNQFIVIHDIENSQMGFAVGSSCTPVPVAAAVENLYSSSTGAAASASTSTGAHTSTGSHTSGSTAGSSQGGNSAGGSTTTTTSTGVSTDPSADGDGLGAAASLAPAGGLLMLVAAVVMMLLLQAAS